MLPRFVPAWVLLLVAIVLTGAPVLAADPRPIAVSVDATDAPRRLYRARFVIPVRPGPLTLYYPKWIQGEHQPSGPIVDLSGVKLTTGGKPVS